MSELPCDAIKIWHNDMKIKQNGLFAQNWYSWCYHRSCHGSLTFPSKGNIIATWEIAIQPTVMTFKEMCIGIAEVQNKPNVNTHFYEHKNITATYGYDNHKNIHCWNEIEAINAIHKYGYPDCIKMVLNTSKATLQFYKNNESVKILKIHQASGLDYRLAISLKDAAVLIKSFKQTIIDCDIDDAKNDEKNDEKMEMEIKNDVYIDNIDVAEIVSNLEEKLKKFQSVYNESTLHKMYDETPQKLLNKQSALNVDLFRIKNGLNALMNSVLTFDDYIGKVNDIVVKLSTPPDEFDYENWDINKMIFWIENLEKGKYKKYSAQLRKGFSESHICKGEYLPDLDVTVLSIQPFNIASFPDKRDLIGHFKRLKSQKIEGGENEKVKQNVTPYI
eukprot:293553_1